MATIRTLLNGVTGTGAGDPVAVDPNIWRGGGSIPIFISGITNATVILQATIATQQEVDEATADWVAISNASWTADVANGLFTPYTHIRGNCTVYVAGTIYMKTLL